MLATTLVMLAVLGGPTPPGPPSLKGRGEFSSLTLAGTETPLSSQASCSDALSPLPFREGGPGGVGVPPPRPAPLRATALDGSPVVWPAKGAGKAACVLFVGTDCPIANAYAPEIVRLVKEFEPKGVTFVVAYPRPDLKADAARRHAREYGFPCPAILDSDLALAKRLGATITPEAVVLSPAGEVLYRGRIDDRYLKVGGKRREVPTSLDLRDALTAALAGKPTPGPWPPAVGCDIDLP